MGVVCCTYIEVETECIKAAIQSRENEHMLREKTSSKTSSQWLRFNLRFLHFVSRIIFNFSKLFVKCSLRYFMLMSDLQILFSFTFTAVGLCLAFGKHNSLSLFSLRSFLWITNINCLIWHQDGNQVTSLYTNMLGAP